MRYAKRRINGEMHVRVNGEWVVSGAEAAEAMGIPLGWLNTALSSRVATGEFHDKIVRYRWRRDNGAGKREKISVVGGKWVSPTVVIRESGITVNCAIDRIRKAVKTGDYKCMMRKKSLRFVDIKTRKYKCNSAEPNSAKEARKLSKIPEPTALEYSLLGVTPKDPQVINNYSGCNRRY